MNKVELEAFFSIICEKCPSSQDCFRENCDTLNEIRKLNWKSNKYDKIMKEKRKNAQKNQDFYIISQKNGFFIKNTSSHEDTNYYMENNDIYDVRVVKPNGDSHICMWDIDLKGNRYWG